MSVAVTGKKGTIVYIGIGSNLGDRRNNIKKALRLVGMVRGVTMERVSSIYETDPSGGPPQGRYLNGVFRIRTTLDPVRLLRELQKVEAHGGRKRNVRNGPRTIDLDILLFGKRRISRRDLCIPHPRLHKREFVLKGLRELTGGRFNAIA